MLTNPNWNVHKDYIVTDVFKPDAANQLASTIPYDYVITQEMLNWGAENAMTIYGIDIAKVLKKGDTGSTTNMTPKMRISVMLDCTTYATTVLNFRNLMNDPWFAPGQGTNSLDIYSRGPFTFTGRNAPTYIHNSYNNIVAVSDLAVSTSSLYVGVFTIASNIPWSGTFIYEDVQGTHVPDGSSVIRTAWMTNKVPIYTADIVDWSSVTEECIITIDYYLDANIPYLIEEGSSDTTTYSRAMEILGKGLIPVLGFMYMGTDPQHPSASGYFRFIPLKSISLGCDLGFEDLRDSVIYYLKKTYWHIEPIDPPIPVKYSRVHVEALRGPSDHNATYQDVGMYQYNSDSPVLVPQIPQGSSLGARELGGGVNSLLMHYTQNWYPMENNCEDFTIWKNSFTSELIDVFELGSLVTSPECRRFRIRFVNDDAYNWKIHFCHTYSGPDPSSYTSYTGNIAFYTNDPTITRKDLSFYEVLVAPAKSVIVNVLMLWHMEEVSPGNIIVEINSDQFFGTLPD